MPPRTLRTAVLISLAAVAAALTPQARPPLKARITSAWRARADADPKFRQKLALEAALADLCVLPKDATPCAPTDLLDELQERDPLEVGFASYLGVDGADFISSLLALSLIHI